MIFLLGVLACIQAAPNGHSAVEPAVRQCEGRYAKGPNVIRLEADGQQLLALPLWWGGYEPLGRVHGSDFSLINRPTTVFSIQADSLTVTGQPELDGSYRKLGPAPSAMELLLSGKFQPAYQGFRSLGLNEKEMTGIVGQCIQDLPSRRRNLYGFVKYLISQGESDRDLIALAGSAAVAIGDRRSAEQWYRQILRESPADPDSISALRQMGKLPTTGGWKLPFAIRDAYAPPTVTEIERVRSIWKNRDLAPRDVRTERVAKLTINGIPITATALSYRIHGQRNFGVILVPDGAKARACPVVVELKGVSPSYFPLSVPDGILIPGILGDDLRKFVVFLPAVRGEQLKFDGNTYSCEGDPDDSWDGATDDAISFLTAGLNVCAEADPRRIVVFGKSRGGTVAMLMGERDPRVAAVCSWSGPAGWIENMPVDGFRQFEMVREGLSTEAGPFGVAGQSIRTFLKPAIEGRMSFEQVRDRLIASSPIYFVSQLPPAQLHYGENDFIVSSENGKSLRAAVDRVSIGRPQVSIVVEPDGGHDLNPKISVPMTRKFLLEHASPMSSIGPSRPAPAAFAGK